MKTVLVTGATGHLGGLLVKELCALPDIKVRIFVLPSERLGGLDGSEVEIVCGDVRDYSAVSRAAKGCDTVFHLASIVAVSASAAEAKIIDAVNVGGTRNVAEACLLQGVRRLVYTSSSEVFKPVSETITEESEFDDGTKFAYQRSKIAATRIVRSYAERGLDTVIVYPTGIIGPHDTRGSLFGRLVRYVAKPWRKSMPLMRCGYDFVDVRDVARGLVAAWENGTAGEEYILSGSDVQLADAVRMMAADRNKKMHITLFPIPIVRFSARIAEFFGVLFRRPSLLTRASLKVILAHPRFSHERAAKRLGYRPRPLKNTIYDTMAQI